MQIHCLKSITVSLLLALAGCGGGQGGSAQPPDPLPSPAPAAITKAEAYRFLNQATFGATEADANTVIDMGFEAWVDDQLTRPASLQLPYLQSLPRPPLIRELQSDRVDIWFRNVLHGEDQLRQRVALALSEIMVVSEFGALTQSPYGLADYYDLLVKNAFGNYRELIESVTLHPSMGVYLSMLGNERPNDDFNIRPDENFARELMQLFSIGLVQLNNDGTVTVDAEGRPIPTYDQPIIEGFAHVFTGWNYAGAASFHEAERTDMNQILPMHLYPEFHDTGTKLLLNGEVLPAGQSGTQDLSDALDNIFNHPNVGPFIAIRLIQRLVTSNPSPAYVDRVASVFNNNGSGVRGDLGAVVKAILRDDEARPELQTDIDGKLNEPLLRLTQLWRSYGAASNSGRYLKSGRRETRVLAELFGQGPLLSPSVFNFFSPFYAPAGEIRNAGLVAPELQIATEYRNTLFANYMFYQCFALNQTNADLDVDDVIIDFSEEMAIAEDADALIDRVAEKLLAGQMSDTLRSEIAGMLALIPAEDTAVRAAETIYFIVTSPEYAYQR